MAPRTIHSVAIALLLVAGAAPAAASPSSRLTTASTKALVRGDAGRALTLANRAIAANPRDPWAYYGQGAAFSAFDRTDAAVRSFAQARDLFGDRNARGRLLAIYGIARAYDNAGRCSEARSVYLQYARLAGPQAGRRALVYGKACRTGAAELQVIEPSTAALAEPTAPNRFDMALLAYRDELIRQSSGDAAAMPDDLGALLDLLATAIEEAPGARDVDIASETEPMRSSGGVRDALLAASYALSRLATGPYATSSSVRDEVSAFHGDVLRVDPQAPSANSAGSPIASALDRADRVLEAIAQAQAQDVAVLELK